MDVDVDVGIRLTQPRAIFNHRLGWADVILVYYSNSATLDIMLLDISYVMHDVNPMLGLLSLSTVGMDGPSNTLKYSQNYTQQPSAAVSYSHSKYYMYCNHRFSLAYTTRPKFYFSFFHYVMYTTNVLNIYRIWW